MAKKYAHFINTLQRIYIIILLGRYYNYAEVLVKKKKVFKIANSRKMSNRKGWYTKDIKTTKLQY